MGQWNFNAPRGFLLNIVWKELRFERD